MKEAENSNNAETQALNIPVVMPRFSVSLVYQNTSSIMLICLILRAKSKNEALGETIEYFEEETKDYGLVLKTVIQLNEA